VLAYSRLGLEDGRAWYRRRRGKRYRVTTTG